MIKEILDTIQKEYSSGSKVFVNLTDDAFLNIDDKDFVSLFGAMAKRKNLIFEVLTKRVDRLLEFFKVALTYAWDEDDIISDLQHICFGVAIADKNDADKLIPQLLDLKRMLDNKVKCFVYLETNVDLGQYLNKLDYVLGGVE